MWGMVLSWPVSAQRGSHVPPVVKGARALGRSGTVAAAFVPLFRHRVEWLCATFCQLNPKM